MSYCRFSSDGFQCDVYAYDDVAGGVTVHVAGYKQRLWYRLLSQIQDWGIWNGHKFGYWCYRAVGLVKRPMLFWPHWLTHYKLNHSEEGARGLGYEEAAQYLEYLRSKGLRVPQYAIDGLREDAANPPDYGEEEPQ